MIPGIMASQYRAPSGGGDPYWSSVASLLHFDGSSGSTTFTDQKGVTWTSGGGNAQISTAQAKFGSGSAYFDGTTNTYISAPVIHMPGDFTLEAWVYIDSTATLRGVFNIGDPTTDNRLQLGIDSNRTLVLYGVRFVPSNQNYVWAISTGTVPVGQWVHVAATRQGLYFRVFIDGVLSITEYDRTGTLTDIGTVGNTLIGVTRSGGSTTRWFKGYIDDARITVGVARYTATFTPPTAPFPNS